jgi:choice-of-anchor B domain-containing protein
MKCTLLFILALSLNLQAQHQPMNVDLVGYKSYTCLSSLWGYTSPDGTEYALVGVCNGTSIVSLSDPANPKEVDFIPAQTSIWRELKVWKNYAYIVTEESMGMQILDLSTLPNKVRLIPFTANIQGSDYLKAHTIFIDEKGIMYLNGVQGAPAGCVAFDLNQTPETPQYLNLVNIPYAHDMYARNNMAYTADIYEGKVSIIKMSDDRQNNQVLARFRTPSGFTHNTWLSDDSKTLFTTDERKDCFVGSYDVSDPNNVTELDRWKNPYTLSEGSIAHNVHVKNDFLVIGHYTDGVTFVDANRPSNLVMTGWFDTHEGDPGTYEGVWGVFPYFKSGLVIGSDRSKGLYILRHSFQRASYLEGNVFNALNNEGIAGASIEIVTKTTRFSNSVGAYKHGEASSGIKQVLVLKDGFYPHIENIEFKSGQVVNKDFYLTPITDFRKRTIRVLDSITLQPLQNVAININRLGTPSEQVTTDAAGYVLIGDYRIDYQARLTFAGLTPVVKYVEYKPASTVDILLLNTSKTSSIAQNHYLISPNPFDNLNLTYNNIYPTPLTAIVFNSMGQKIFNLQLEPGAYLYSIDFNALSSGVYFMQVYMENSRIDNAIKLIKR